MLKLLDINILYETPILYTHHNPANRYFIQSHKREQMAQLITCSHLRLELMTTTHMAVTVCWRYLNPVPSSVFGQATRTRYTKLTSGGRPPSQSSVLLLGLVHFCTCQTPQNVLSALESICREKKITLSWLISGKEQQSWSEGWPKTLSLVQQKESLTSSSETLTRTLCFISLPHLLFEFVFQCAWRISRLLI